MGIEKQLPNKSTRIVRQDSLLDDDNRIDWDRKQKHRREDDPEEVLENELEDVILDTVDLIEQPVKKGHKHKKGKDKRRHLVYDEEVGRVVVKRKRKRRYEAWDDEV